MSLMGGLAMAGGLLMQGANRNAQYNQQKKLQELQIKGQKELGHFNQKQAMDMWEKTNYSAQVEQMEKAGLSKALMYGGGGAGGATAQGGQAGAVTGGQADGEASRMMAQAQTAQTVANLELTKAQAEKTKAEADNISGEVKTGLGLDNKNKQFDLDVKNAVGYQGTADAIKWANEKIQIDSQKANADWEAYKAGAFNGKSFDDKNSPVAKAINAGFNESVEQLKQTRLENNAKGAENIVKEFEARMAENGIHPNSPWYVKLIGDLLERAGITDVMKAGAKRMGGK